jgi:hypothetical protein
MRQSLSLSRPATVKLLHVTLRTLHNWETGKVRIPYAAFKLVRLFSSYEIFHPIWKDWRIVGSRLVTPEGHSLEAGNFHWLSLMARKAEAFNKVNQQLRELTLTLRDGKMADKGASIAPSLPDYRDNLPLSKSVLALGLVSISTSDSRNQENQLLQGSQGHFDPPFKPQPKPSQNRPCRAIARKRHFAHYPDFIPQSASSLLTRQVVVRGDLC